MDTCALDTSLRVDYEFSRYHCHEKLNFGVQFGCQRPNFRVVEGPWERSWSPLEGILNPVMRILASQWCIYRFEHASKGHFRRMSGANSLF